MKLILRRSPEQIQAFVRDAGIVGHWGVEGDKHVCRTDDGGMICWWPSTGTITCQGKPEAKARLEKQLQAACVGTHSAESGVVGTPNKGRIFLVHGHDRQALDQLELVLHKLGFDPTVLVNTAGGGKTIIEALEGEIGKYARSDFGIVLMTPDDKGFAVRDGEKEIKPRPRQNVVLEMGMLLASLTRARVAILQKGFVEAPSDIQGVIYIHYNEHIKETVPKLAERLQQCGFSISTEQIAKAAS